MADKEHVKSPLHKQYLARVENEKPPLHKQYLARLGSHRAVAILIVIGTIVIALASFTDAAKKLGSAFHRQQPEEARQELARLSVPFTPDEFSAAAAKGDLMVTKLFLTAGMRADEIPRGDVPIALVAAVRENRPEVVELLLKAGADPALRASGFSSALGVAATLGNKSVVTTLLNGKPIAKEAIDAAFLRAAYAGQPEMLRLLQVRGADARGLATRALEDAVGATRAEENSMADTVTFLLQAGADIKATSGESDWTPLHSASYNSHAAVIKVLLEHGATLDARDRDGRTPLWWAAGVGRLDAATILLAKGADANVRDKEGMTVLGRAKYNRDERMVKLLQASGAK